MWETFWQDLHYGLRTLLKHPSFTFIAMLTLALGIGANTAIFSVVNGVLLRSLPFEEADRLVAIWEANHSGQQMAVSKPNFLDWQQQNQTFAHMAYYTAWTLTVTGGKEPVRAFNATITRDFFSVLQVKPILGRGLLPADHQFGADHSVVVSYGFWQRNLGGEADLTRLKLTVDDASYHVVGVMPQGFNFPAGTELCRPREYFNDMSGRNSHNYRVIARMKPGITLQQAQTEMTAIAQRLEQQYPSENREVGAVIVPLQEQLVGSSRPLLLALSVAVGLVLLICCVNVANLLLARALSRQKEIAIRSALGAGRWRITRQLLTESFLLSLLGGALGLMVTRGLVDLLVALSPGYLPRLGEINIDGRTLTFALGLSIVTSLLFGLAPALRISKPDLTTALKGGNQSAGGSIGRQFLINSLVISEIALTMVLLIGAGLLIKSFWRLLEVKPGLQTENVLTVRMSLPWSETDDHKEPQTVAAYRQALERIATLPGVVAAGAINRLPLSGAGIAGRFYIEGQPDSGGNAEYRIVSPDYFRTLQIPLLKGRLLTAADNENAAPVILINENMARHFWPGGNPIGQRIRTGGMDPSGNVWVTIIGVVGNVRHYGLDKESADEYYLPYMQRPRRANDMTLVVRTISDPTAIASDVRRQIQAVNPSVPVKFGTMDQVLVRSSANRRYPMFLLGIFASAALLLSVIGVYGVMSYTVTQNTREIGIRMALGAQPRDVLKLIIGQGLVLTLFGGGIGAVGAFGLTRLIAGFLFGVSVTDPLTFSGVFGLLVLAALLACYLPARRAAKVDPMVALRYE